MKDKYYTPSIEEFRVGFEYELQNIENAQWRKVTCRQGFGAFDDDIDDLEEGRIRVKYLDEEDLYSLGFEYNGEPAGCKFRFKSKKILYPLNSEFDHRFFLELSSDLDIFRIFQRYSSLDIISRFQGKIKNISELKVLLKQLGIEYDK